MKVLVIIGSCSRYYVSSTKEHPPTIFLKLSYSGCHQRICNSGAILKSQIPQPRRLKTPQKASSLPHSTATSENMYIGTVPQTCLNRTIPSHSKISVHSSERGFVVSRSALRLRHLTLQSQILARKTQPQPRTLRTRAV